MFDQAKWIWCSKAEGPDSYSEFLLTEQCRDGDSVKMRISVDSNYAVYVNGVFADSGQYADLPHYKVFDEIDLSGYMKQGVNHIAVIVWYYGLTALTYYLGKPGLLFELEKNGQVVQSSDASVLSRKSRRYIGGQKKFITMMLGLSFRVDLRESDDWMTGADTEGFEPSIIKEDLPQTLFPRISKKLEVHPLLAGQMVQQGSFSYPAEASLTRHGGDRMQNAALSFFRLAEMEGEYEEPIGGENAGLEVGRYKNATLTFVRRGAVYGPVTLLRKTGEGIYFVLDLGKEITGYLEFDLEVPESCSMEVGWGEHLADGRCRTAVGERDEDGSTQRNFSVEVQLKAGRNHYMNPFRRFGGRYLQFFIKTSKVRMNCAGVRPSLYPVTVKEYKTGNLLRDEIYAVCVNTLIQCMHEHYEDCPWREQAFYTGDSRNQMLAGYYAFGELDLPKASLRLIAESVRDDDDMQPLCFPSDHRLCIPGGVPVFATMLAEYYEHSKDLETIAVCFDKVKRNMDAFVRRIDETGLIPNFDEKDDFWNFYEWQPYVDGSSYRGPGNYDMCLNAGYSYHLSSFIKLCRLVGYDAAAYETVKEKLNQKIVENFYDPEIQLFRVCVGPNPPITSISVLCNVQAFLCGAADMVDNGRMLELIRTNGASEPELETVPTTLYNTFERFNVLLQVDESKYRDDVLDQIDAIFFKMLKEGATSFWETELGQMDFEYAGSLCHGWGAMPILFYQKLLK